MNREYKIALSQEYYSDIVYLSQYDSDYDLVFSVLDKYSKATQINGYTAKFQGTRTDGLGFLFEGTASDDRVAFRINTSLTAISGTHKGEIVFYDANGLFYGSANVQIVVEPAARPDGTIDADVERAEEIAEQIQQIVDTAAEQTTAQAEQIVADLEADVSQIKEDLSDIQTATASDVGKALKVKTVTDGKVTEWEFGETGVAVDPTLSIEGKAADAKKVGDKISEITGELDEIIDYEVGTNLSNPNTQTSGYYIALDGNLIEAELYDVTDFIPVEVGKSYSVGVYNLSNALYKTRTLYAFYDANKTLVGSVTNTDNTSGLLATAPSGASYIRISGHTHFSNNIYSLMLAESDTILASFIPFSETMVLSDNVKVRGLDELEPLIGTAEYKTGKNLYDSSKSVDGFLKYNGAITSIEGQNYKTSALIPVKPNTDYYVTGFSSSFLPYKTRLIAACYTEGAFVTNTYINTSSVFSIVINSQNYSHIRVCAAVRIMVTEGAPATQYVDYVGGDYTTLKVETQNLPFDPILTGKKWAVCGDSFTNSGGTGTLIEDGLYKGRPYTYPWLIGNRQSMEIIKFFEGGRTLAYPSSGTFHNSLTDPTADCYYQNIPEDVDYITIYLGINDEHHATGGGDGEDSTGNIPLGTITDNDASTYYGAWNVVLSWLITNRPNAHIGIIVTNGLSIEAYRTAQIEIARKYGIPFIDMNGDDRTPAMLRTVNPNIATLVKQALIAKWAVDPTGASGAVNTHPNDDAQLFESYFIEDFLRSI